MDGVSKTNWFMWVVIYSVLKTKQNKTKRKQADESEL